MLSKKDLKIKWFNPKRTLIKKSHYILAIAVHVFLFLVVHNSVALSNQVDVKVEGVAGGVKQNVLSLLEIYKERNDSGLTAGRIEYLFNKGYSDIKKALMPFGYFDPKITGLLKREKGQKWQVVYVVKKGPAFKVCCQDLKITGSCGKTLSSLFKVPFKKGEVFNQEKYEDFKSKVLTKARSLGCLDAFFKKHEVIIDKKRHQAEIHLHLIAGKRYHFGRIRFRKSVLSSRFLSSFTDIKYGQPFDVSRLGTFRTRLLDSDYFKNVEIDYSTEDVSDNATVPITVTCTMKRPNVFRLGLGYVSDVGPRVSLEYKRRYLTSSGHHLRARFQFSSEETLLSGEYFVPVGRPYSDYLSLKPFIEHYDTSSRNGWRYNVALNYSVATGKGWRRNAGINFGYEDYKTGGEHNNNKELRPFMSWNKSVADNVLYANRGYSIKFGLSGEVGGILAESSYLSSTFSSKFIKRITSNYRVLSRLDAGIILASKVDDIPSSSRFYAGGQGSIRGFSLEELGPKNKKTGEVIGGRYLAVGSLELERHIYKLLSGAIFLDAGNSFDPDYSNKVEIGTGFGLRLKTVIGPVRLDFGFGISKPSIPFKFYLSVGPDF